MDELSVKGVEHYNAGRFEEALRCFRAALDRGDKDPQTHVFLGHVANSLGRRSEALAAFAAVIKTSPRHLPAYTGLANIILHLCPDRDLPAEGALRGILSIKPGKGSARARLVAALRSCGQAFRAAGDLEMAEKALSRALLLGACNASAQRRLADVVHLRGQSYLASGNLEKAEKELRRVLTLKPGHKSTSRGLARLLCRRSEASVAAVLRRQGIALISKGRLAQAERTLRRSLRVGPHDKEAGRVLLDVLRMREQARHDAETKTRLEKAEKIRILTEELHGVGQGAPAERVKRAEGLLIKILRIDPANARAYLVAGEILCAAGASIRGRRLLLEALRLGRRTLGGGETFAALIKLGRYKAAIVRAERVLDGKPTLADLRAFWDPWGWTDRPLAARRRELRAFEQALSAKTRALWTSYYRSGLDAAEAPQPLNGLPEYSRRRYSWMLSKTGHTALCMGNFPEAERQLRAALKYKVLDWRTRGSLAETLLCLRRPDEAFAEMERAAPDAPADESGQVVAWRGAFDLWLGHYDEALRRFDEALRLDSAYAISWRGAALLKLGRTREALEALDRALTLHPRDLEAYVWRGETKRALGLHREALVDLNEPALAGDGRATPIWLWALVNRALAKEALGDQAGFTSDYAAIPRTVLDYIRKKSGQQDRAKILLAGLNLARGFRREEYGQAIWMI